MLRIPPSLYHRRYLYLWAGLLVSVAGSQMQVAAIHWHIREITPEPVALGAIGAARILPVIVFSLIGGTIADTFNRRRILLVSQTSMALLALGLAWLTFAGHLQLWHIYGFTALQAVAVSFDLPARQALVPNLVPPRDLPNAFSMNSIAANFGAVAGPALGGLVIARLGLGYTYLFNGVSFLAVILALIAMGPVAQPQPVNYRHRLSIRGMGEGIREGIQFILHSPMILSTMVMDFVATFFSSANTLMPIVARDILRVGALEYGWLVSGQAVGSISAAFTISQMREIRYQGKVFLTSVVVFGLATVAFGFANTFGMAMLALILIGAADSVSTVIRNTIRQMQTPDHIRGRMTSVNQIFFQGGPQLGEVEAGFVAQLLGVPFAIVSGGLACIAGVYFIVRKWPQLKDYDGLEPVPGD